LRARKYFTIVELLIAMGLMMVVANILASVYARMSQHAVGIVMQQKDSFDAAAAINRIAKDFENAKIENNGFLAAGRSLRLLSSFANPTVTITSGFIKNVKANGFLDTSVLYQSSLDQKGYPYLVMTALDRNASNADIVNGIKDGYKEVVYWLLPTDLINDKDGEVSKPLQLIRSEACNYNTANTYFKEGIFDTYNKSDNVLLDNVVAVNFLFDQLNKEARDRPLVTFNNNPEVDFNSATNGRQVFVKSGTELANPMPDYVDVLISVLPNFPKSFTTGALSTISDHYEDITDFAGKDSLGDPAELIGQKLDLVDINFEDDKTYKFQKEGHLWLADKETVLHYRKFNDSLYLTIQSGGKSSVATTGTFTIAEPIFKRIYLK